MRPPVDWPNGDVSHSQNGPIHDWHYQRAGSGEQVLLLHGAGTSSHSMYGILRDLSQVYDVMAPDLPGHGFTRLGAQQRSNLRHMSEDICALCDSLDFRPLIIVAHSAGCAIALQIARTRPSIKIIGINAALENFAGLAGRLFPAIAKTLAAIPFTSRLVSMASSDTVRLRNLIESTGSKLDDEVIQIYQRLVTQDAHISGTLSMMAQWSLDNLRKDLPKIEALCMFLVGTNDKTVSPQVSKRAANIMQFAMVQDLQGLGHLAHEEAPDQVCQAIHTFIQSTK